MPAGVAAAAGRDRRPDRFRVQPITVEDSRNAGRGAQRATPNYPSHMKRNAAKRVKARTRPPGLYYTTCTFRRAIERACERAGVLTLTPHRLRHLAATRTGAELGVDVARALLGHSMASVTEVYSHEVDKQLA